MKGILLKEVYASSAYRKNMVLMMGIVVILSIVMDMGPSYPTMMMMMYLLIVSIGLYSIDENSKWDRFACSMPLKRTTIVGGRYLFLALALLVFAVFSVLLGLAMALVKGYTDRLPEIMATVGVSCLVFLFANSIAAPIVYKFGPEKSRFAIMFIFMLPFLGVILLMMRLEAVIAGFTPTHWALIGVGFC